jgi:hypothetical protein
MSKQEARPEMTPEVWDALIILCHNVNFSGNSMGVVEAAINLVRIVEEEYEDVST